MISRLWAAAYVQVVCCCRMVGWCWCPPGAKHVGLYDPSKDQWTEGKDDLSVCGLQVPVVSVPDGRVVLVPWNAKHVGLYDPSKDQWKEC